MSAKSAPSPPRTIRVIPLPECIHASRLNTVLYYVSLAIMGGSVFLQLLFPYSGSEGTLLYIFINTLTIIFIFYFQFILTRTFFILMLSAFIWYIPFLIIIKNITFYILEENNFMDSRAIECFFNILICAFIDFILLYIANFLLRNFIKNDFKNFIIPFVLCKMAGFTMYLFIIVAVLISLPPILK
ncbi:MAG: hypothetical protein RRY29_10530 [Desulfovibrionaceae bacterium]